MSNQPTPPSVVIEHNGAVKNDKLNLVARFPDGSAYTLPVKIGDPEARTVYRDALVERCPGLEPEQIDERLEEIAADTLGSGGGKSKFGSGSLATQIVSLVESDAGTELFHTPGGYDSEGYAAIAVGDRRETWAIGSKALRRWLSRKVFLQMGKAPNGQAMTDAINVLAGKAIHEGGEHEVHVRVAEHDGAIWIDMADQQWRAIKVTAEGWEVVEKDIPVRFIRKRGMKPLPPPTRGGKIEDIRPLVNLRRESDWILAVAWLIAAFRPGFPFPVLNVTGEQGSAKSTLCEMIRSLIDPAKPLLRRPPKSERDLMIAASNAHVVAYDNISSISESLSDSMCCLATGGGFGARELYTDDDEKLFDSVRPVMLNGIDDSITRSDLFDRTVNLHLLEIPPKSRRDERKLWAEFYRKRPGILGALLDAVSTALRNQHTTTLEHLPRMADFALWIAAAEPALPWEPGAFMRVYASNRADSDAAAIESSPIGPPILQLLDREGKWQGTAGNLLRRLEDKYAGEHTRRHKHWPTNSKAMGNALRRIAPNLKRLGIEVDLPEKTTGHDKDRIFRLERPGGPRSARTAPPANPPGGPVNAGSTDDLADHRPTGDPAPPEPDGDASGPESPPADHADHADRTPPTYPHGSGKWWKQ